MYDYNISIIMKIRGIAMKTKVLTEIFDLEFQEEVNRYVSEGYEVKGFSHTRDQCGDSWYSCLLILREEND